MDITEKLEIAEGYIQTEKYKKAIEYLTDIISKNPNEYKAFIERGHAFFCIANVEKSISDLTHAISINNKADKAFWYLSQIYITKDDFQKAKKMIIEALKIDKDNLNYICDFVFIEENLKNYKNCIKLCEIILSDYPEDTFALNVRGHSYIELKEYNNAIYDLEKSLSINPHDYLTLNNLGFALSKSGRHKEAYKYFERAIEIEPNFAYPYDNLGYVYYLNGDNKNALKLINKSIELDKSNSWAYKNRALVYISLNDKEKARIDLQLAKELGYTQEYDNEVEELLISI